MHGGVMEKRTASLCSRVLFYIRIIVGAANVFPLLIMHIVFLDASQVRPYLLQ